MSKFKFFIAIILIAFIAESPIAFANSDEDSCHEIQDYSLEENFALKMDEEDGLKNIRHKFAHPKQAGKEVIYLNGNSLGLAPLDAEKDMINELQDWQNLGVEGHFKKNDPWYSYQKQFAKPLANIVGAYEDEVVVMNSLTVNLHLLLSTFYRPEGSKTKILIEEPLFSSDTYAVKSQIRIHNLDQNENLIIVKPKDGISLKTSDIEAALEANKNEVAVVLLSGVNFLTGQLIDIPSISKITHKYGAYLGIDLAHAIGNVPLALHKDEVDFAAWCSYKYLNSGPGALAGIYIHRKHAKNTNLPRLAGWWGNDPKNRFMLHLEKDFHPAPSADGWQISNPPIFAMVPMKSSLKIYEEVGMKAFREKSLKLTGYMEFLIKSKLGKNIKIITPSNPQERGCQLSLVVNGGTKEFHQYLSKNGIIADFRKPNVIRVAPVPLYNSFHEVWRFVDIASKYFA